MKRHQKRYTDERAILAEINEAQREAQRLLESSVDLDKSSADKFHQCADLRERADSTKTASQKNDMILQSNALQIEAEKDRTQSQKQNKTRNNILNCKLPRLKNVLAAFRTGTFEFCGGDKGVTL